MFFYFRPSDTDNFLLRTTVDIESESGESKEMLKDHLINFISNFRTFNPNSPLTIIQEGFDIDQGNLNMDVKLGELFVS